MERLVKVRLGRKDYLIPHNSSGDRLIRITDHPLDMNKLLVWRQNSGPVSLGREERRAIMVTEATRHRSRIREGERIAGLAYFHGSGDAEVFHFEVLPEFQRKTIGTALMETALKELKGKAWEVSFPLHREWDFYLKRGLKAKGDSGKRRRFSGKVGELGVKPGPVKLRVLWQRSRPRFVKKRGNK